MIPKKVRKYIEEKLNRDKVIRFAKKNNPALYNTEFEKHLQKYFYDQKQHHKGRIQAQREIQIVQYEQELQNIENPWLRRQIAKEKIKKTGAYKKC